jgi:hypothetical protein
MRLIAPLAAWLSLGLSVAAGHATALVSIDQGPIVRVLRLSDVPQSREGDLPSGALTATQFAFSNDSTGTARREEVHILLGDGFKSSAISEIGNSGRLLLKSGAIELGSPALAAKALTAETALCAHTQAPAHTVVTTAPDRNFPTAFIVTFSPTVKGGMGGLEILVRSGSYLYTLQGTDEPDDITRGNIEHLLKVVMARS